MNGFKCAKIWSSDSTLCWHEVTVWALIVGSEACGAHEANDGDTEADSDGPQALQSLRSKHTLSPSTWKLFVQQSFQGLSDGKRINSIIFISIIFVKYAEKIAGFIYKWKKANVHFENFLKLVTTGRLKGQKNIWQADNHSVKVTFPRGWQWIFYETLTFLFQWMFE